MRLGISQPCFLPWPGYFGLIDYVDEFIILDDVQFEKRSWQQRNYIKLNDKPYLVTLPIINKNRFKQKIFEANLSDIKFKKDISIKLFHAYKKKKYFDFFFSDIESILNNADNKLFDVNIKLIYLILNILKIKTKIEYQSRLKINNKKEKLIFDICIKKKCDEYITTIGAQKYLKNLKFIPGTTKQIKYFTYDDVNIKTYGHTLSVIDLIFTYGQETINVIRENFKIIN